MMAERRDRRGRPRLEPSVVVRIPASLKPTVSALKNGRRERPAVPLAPAAAAPLKLERPLFLAPSPQAGFANPAADALERPIDLNELLVRRPEATYYVRVQGDSMRDALINDGDVLVVDRSVPATAGRIVVATYDGDFYVKRLRAIGGRLALCSENQLMSELQPMFLDSSSEHEIWGVVIGTVRRF